MRKIFGIVCLVLALLSGMSLVKLLGGGNSERPRGTPAYETGRKVGAVTAPLVFGALSLWLLAGGSGSDRHRPGQSPPIPPAAGAGAGVRPASSNNKLVWIALSGVLALLLMVTLIVAVAVVGRLRRAAQASKAPPPPAQVHPIAPGVIDFSGRTATFTNLHGRRFDRVQLVRADAHFLVILNQNGVHETVPLRLLPLTFLSEIGVPTNAPGVLAGRIERRAAPSPGASGGWQEESRFKAGEAVEVRWAGRWQRAEVLGGRRSTVQVQLEDPAFPNPIWISTNLVRQVEMP